MDVKAAYPNAKTQAELQAMPLLTIADFRSDLTYHVPEKVGVSLPATAGDPAPGLFLLKAKVVKPSTINQDLVEFQDYVRRNQAYA